LLLPGLPDLVPIALSRCRPLLALGMLVLAGHRPLNAIAASDQDNPAVTATGQVSVHLIGAEELSAYESAMGEQDPQKRADRLYEFIQKYPQSYLIKRISNENFARIKMLQEEQAACYYAGQEPDPETRALKLIDFNKTYPQSKLAENIRNAYMEMLRTLYEENKYERVAALGEKWLATHEQDRDAQAFVGEASMQLGNYQQCGERLEALYGSMPSSRLARQIQICYQKAGNHAKFVEWADKLIAMAEFDADYELRQECMLQSYDDNNLLKAAQYAQLTLKAADLVQSPDAATLEQLRKARRASYHVIASNLMDQGKYIEAIPEFERALQAEKYAQGYYGIALCYDNSKKIDEAILYYAVAELMGGGGASKSKMRLETLYKAIHNDTLIGIEKVYSKARKLL
jgi:tetratricopeptide (TPR) repeat protein